MRILTYRQSKQIEQADMAAAIGISGGNLSNIESGARAASWPLMCAIIRYSKGAITAGDMLETWAEKHGEKLPKAAKTAL